MNAGGASKPIGDRPEREHTPVVQRGAGRKISNEWIFGGRRHDRPRAHACAPACYLRVGDHRQLVAACRRGRGRADAGRAGTDDHGNSPGGSDPHGCTQEQRGPTRPWTIAHSLSRWYQCGVGGAMCTSSAVTTYLVPPSDVGKTISWRSPRPTPTEATPVALATASVASAAGKHRGSTDDRGNCPGRADADGEPRSDGTGATTFAYQWAVAAASLYAHGPTGSSYIVAAADVGKTIAVTVTATGPGGSVDPPPQRRPQPCCPRHRRTFRRRRSRARRSKDRR